MASKDSNRRYILLRYALVSLLMLMLSGAIVYKAIDTCIIHASAWNEKVRPELEVTREIMPERGDILAHDGLVLATSMTCYQAVVDFSIDGFDDNLFEKELPALCEALVDNFPNKLSRSNLTAKECEEELRKARQKPIKGYTLVRDVTGQEIKLLATFPFLKEKQSKTGYYINRVDGDYEAYIDFSTEKFDGELFLVKLDSLCQMLEAKYPQRKAADYEKILRDGYAKRINSKDKKSGPRVVFLEGLSYGECRELETFPYLKMPKLRTGFNLNKTGGKVIKRVKPYETRGSRAIGSLNSASQRGNSGLEMALDSLLFGVPGCTERRILSNGMVDWTSVPPQRGMDVKTTIDVVIQDITEEALEEVVQEAKPEFGVAIVMEVATGEIKAISNLTRLDDGTYSEECRNNAVLPYEPGSVVKALTMMIALEDGVVTPDEKLNGHGGRFYYEGAEITDEHVYSDLNVFKAITYSSNIGMAQIAIKGYEKNPHRFVERIHEVGFMEPFNLGIAGESQPIIRLKPQENERRDLASMAYGYTTAIPPIYTVAFYNAIANGGKFVKPRLVKELIRDGKVEKEFGVSYIREQMCKPETAKLLQEMLLSVVYGVKTETGIRNGTGKAVRSDKVKIAGKTGTVKVGDKNGYREGEYRITFCGFFPYENPQYTCLVLLNNPERNPQKWKRIPPAGSWCGGAVKNIAETLYDMGRLETSFQSLPDTTVTFQSGVLKGDKAAAQAVLQQLNAQGNVEQCYDINKEFTSIPNVQGLGARDALYILEKLGLKVRIEGHGKVVSQSIEAGSPIETNATIVLKLE